MRLFSVLFLGLVFKCGLSRRLNGHEFENYTKVYAQNLQGLTSRINHLVQPCDDFFKHACGSSGKSMDALPSFLYNQQDRANFFYEQHVNFRTRPGQIIAQLYEECKERHVGSSPAINRTSMLYWRRLLKELHFNGRSIEKSYSGWPFLRHEWNLHKHYHNLSWVNLAAQLAAHGVPSLLNVYFAEQTIFVAPMEMERCPSAEQIRDSLLALVDFSGSHLVNIVASELLEFCKKLREEMFLDMNNEESQKSVLDVLIDKNIIAYFEQFFSVLNFTEAEVEQARKLPISVNRIAGTLKLLHQTEPRIVLNFVIWHLSEKLRFEDCYSLVEEFERFFSAECWHWHIFEPYLSRQAALAAYRLHTTRFQKLHNIVQTNVDWFELLQIVSKGAKTGSDILQSMEVFANSYLNVHNLSERLQDLAFRPGTFYANILDLRRNRLRASYFEELIDADDFNHPSHFLRYFLHFSISLLKQPLYHYYATLGLELWYTSNLHYDTDGFYTALDCLERQTSMYQEDAPIYRRLDDGDVDQIFRFYIAFTEALRDYQFWLESEKFAFAEHDSLAHFSLDTERILFYEVAQLHCERNDWLYSTLVNRAFMNMPEFQFAFSCSASEPMNPIAKCMIRRCNVI